MAIAGVGTKSDPYTVDDLLAMEIPSEPVEGVYVKAYIVGYIPGMNWSEAVFSNEKCEVKTNIVIASTAQENDIEYAMPVAIPAGSLRDVLSIGANPNVLGHEVLLCATWTKYFGVNGLKDVSSYEWIGEAPDTPVVSGETGTADKPLTVAEFLAMGKPNAAIPNTYVTGVIVGYIPDKTLSEAIIGQVPATSATNLLLAESSSVTDYNQCIPVQLPTGAVRNALNLKDNEGNLGKTVTLLGSHEAYFGANGLKSVTQYAFGFKMEGGETPTPSGDTGSKDAPLSVDQYLALGIPTASVANTWVKGYIVGYIDGMNLSGATFSVCNGTEVPTNVLIAQTASVTDVNQCIPVQLPAGEIRSALNLLDNKDILGKVVTLCGSREKYFGALGLKSTKEYFFEGQVVADAIYVGLENTMDEWTVENTIMEEPLTYIWKWDEKYNCAVGSSFMNNEAYASEAFLISPVIDLTEVVEANVKFEHAAKYQTTFTELCGLVVREAGDNTWSELTISTWPAAGTWNFASTGEISLSAWEGKKIELALKYAGSTEGADTWEVKNFKVTGTKVQGHVEGVDVADDVIYGGNGCVIAPEGSKVFNLNGVAIGKDNLAKGLYIVVTPRGAKKVIVK